METKQIDILYKIVAHYTKEQQVGQAIEEMGELIVELNKNINRGRNNIEEITSEIADVKIMLAQLQLIYKIDDNSIKKEIEKKLNRQKERMSNEEK